MKYGIIVSDLTAADAKKLLDQLSGQTATVTASIEDEDNEGVASNATFDATGLPWDERIHAGSKKQNADGTWKKRKGVQPVTVTEVEAELRAAAPFMASNAEAAAPVNNYLPPSTAPHPVQALPVNPVVQIAPMSPIPVPAATAPQPIPPAAPMPPAAPQPIVRDFNGLMTQIGQLYKTQAVTDPNYPQTIVQRINAGFSINTIVNITDIAGNPEYVEYAWKCLEVDGNAA
jgi:hypothetical protein